MTEYINKDNFAEHFFDVRDHTPRKGDCIARFRAVAELIDGFEKRQMIQLLGEPNSHFAIAQMMRKLCHAREPYTFRVPQMMAADLLEGMSPDEVAEKPYEYELELFYYTKPENVPKNDPQWTIIKLVNTDDYFSITQGEW